MEFVSVRELRLQPGRVWERLAKAGELVVTSNGKPIALLSGVTGETLEETLRAVRRARAQQALAELRAAAQERGTDQLTPGAIKAEIRLARQARRRSARSQP